MTDTEIKKALECCGFDEDMCLDCPVQCDCEKDTEAMIDRAKAILDLINRQQAEIERLKADNQESDILIDMQDKALREQTATIEELDADCKKYKAERDEFANHFGKACEVGRVEAIKDVIARVKKEATLCCKGAFELNPKTPYGGKSEITKEYRITEDKLEAIVEEMVGE